MPARVSYRSKSRRPGHEARRLLMTRFGHLPGRQQEDAVAILALSIYTFRISNADVNSALQTD